MKLIAKTLHYIVGSNEQTGMWCERVVCDILKIPFNSKRDYITSDNYPSKLARDLKDTLQPFLMTLNITKHEGNKNDAYDFLTFNNQHISLKTNTNGFKVCPALIGQTTLQKLNKYFKQDLTKDQFKEFIINNTHQVLKEYLKYIFICKHTFCIKFDTGKIYYFNTNTNTNTNIVPELDLNTDDIQDQETPFTFTNTLENWNESNTLKIKVNEQLFSLAEFQIHNNRNCIKCRFNFDTVIKLINLNVITGIALQEFNMKYKYNIKNK